MQQAAVTIPFYAMDGSPAVALAFDPGSPTERPGDPHLIAAARGHLIVSWNGIAVRTRPMTFLRPSLVAFLVALETFAARREGEARLASARGERGATGWSSADLRLATEGLARRAILEATIEQAAIPDRNRREGWARLELRVDLAPSHWEEALAGLWHLVGG
jgi:hypothetical protein